jgi:hypothetical protein
VRRTLLLLLLVVIGAVALIVVEAPHRPTSRELVRGARLLKVPAKAVRGITATFDDRGFTATRTTGGWQIDGVPASSGVAEALDDVVSTLVDLRAIDVFRADRLAQFGLEPPRGSITVTTKRGSRRIELGDANASGSAIYARREGDRRIFQIGVFLPSALERVIYQRDSGGAAPIPPELPTPDQIAPPEAGRGRLGPGR